MKINITSWLAALIIFVIVCCILGMLFVEDADAHPHPIPTPAPTMDPDDGFVYPTPGPIPTRTAPPPIFKFYMPFIHNEGDIP